MSTRDANEISDEEFDKAIDNMCGDALSNMMQQAFIIGGKSQTIFPGQKMIVRPHLVCKDGTEISVQASSFHYCSPRNNVGPYSEVEIACLEDELFKDCDDEGNCYEWKVYGYVPVDLVKQFIEKHGGFASLKELE